jgi:fructokinase
VAPGSWTVGAVPLPDFRAARPLVDDARAVVDAARAGDALACAALGRYVDRLGRSLAGVVNILDVDVIVLRGGLCNVPELHDSLPAVLARHVFSDAVRTRVLPPVHGDSSGVLGAAWLWPWTVLGR